MASRYYGADVGAMNKTHVTEDSSTNTKAVEVSIDLAKTTSKLAVLQALDAIRDYLITVETDPIV
jgi:hypothetical protein